MIIHVVRPGETVDSIAAGYGVAPKQLAADNALPPDYALAVGQTLVVRFPQAVHVVTAGETLTSIAAQYGTTVRQLWRNNWALGGGEALAAGQLLVVSYFGEKIGEGVFNGYAYPFISQELLAAQLPYLSTMAPFTYGITGSGGLLPLEDEAMLSAARARGTKPVMHLSTLTEAGQFDTSRAETILTDYEAQGQLAAEVLQTVLRKDFAGLDVDFEYLPGQLAGAYAAFLGRLRQLLSAQGRFLWAALAPKTNNRQRGLLYEGHDYAAVAAAVDGVLLMTYECGSFAHRNALRKAGRHFPFPGELEIKMNMGLVLSSDSHKGHRRLPGKWLARMEISRSSRLGPLSAQWTVTWISRLLPDDCRTFAFFPRKTPPPRMI